VIRTGLPTRGGSYPRVQRVGVQVKHVGPSPNPYPLGAFCGYGNPSTMRLDAAQCCICSADCTCRRYVRGCHILASSSHVIQVIRVALSSASSTPSPVIHARCVVVHVACQPCRPLAASRCPRRPPSSALPSSASPIVRIVSPAVSPVIHVHRVFTHVARRLCCGGGVHACPLPPHHGDMAARTDQLRSGGGNPEAVGREWVSAASEDEGRRAALSVKFLHEIRLVSDIKIVHPAS
jgi:hypothetical protein